MLHLRCAGAILAVLACACAQPDPPGDDDDGGPIVDPGPATTSDELFALERLPALHIELSPAAWAALEAEPKAWVPGRFEYEGTILDPIGVRLKGNHSFRPIDDKPSFKLSFDKYVHGQRFLGLEGLTLNNMVVDSSMLREWIGYRVFRELDAPASRAGYAQVFVNDQEYGLYLSLEPYDDEFLARVYADPSGNLYESDKSADLDKPLESWDQDEGSDLSRDDLAAFSALALSDGDAVFYGDQAAVDMQRFFAFMAGEVIVGHFDGHMGGHNFFIYHEPTADLWSYQPWSLDQALARRVTPYEHEGYLGDKCMHDERCLVDYVLAFQQLLPRIADLDLDAEIEQAIALTDAAMRSDPRKPYSDADVESGRDRSRDYILGRAAELGPQLDCLVAGEQPDADQDGYGPCFQDCDESDPAINPDAAELCDGVDNDCTGFVDDTPSCECPSVVSEGQTFWLCHNDLTWLQARDYCGAQGRVLAHFASASQTDAVWEAAAAISGGRWAIGLDDRATEGVYLWSDGSTPSFDAWASGEPSHMLDWFDCVFLQSGAWFERNCIESGSFICGEP